MLKYGWSKLTVFSTQKHVKMGRTIFFSHKLCLESFPDAFYILREGEEKMENEDFF